MARSFRKTPIFGITLARSEKADKRIWHQRLRTHVRTRLGSVSEFEAYMDPAVREVSNLWDFAKDGKRYWSLAGLPRAPGARLTAEKQSWRARAMRK